jgi:hypothetical protein
MDIVDEAYEYELMYGEYGEELEEPSGLVNWELMELMLAVSRGDSPPPPPEPIVVEINGVPT